MTLDKFGSDVKRQVVEELHKPARKIYKRRRVVVKGLNDLYQADLVEMIPYARQNGGYKYILVVIDVFSKFVWANPVKTKSAKDITNVMKKILSSKTPRNLQTDMGKEFYNKDFSALMKKLNINHYSTFSSTKASVVERVNRTLKSLMWKEFSMQGSYKWLKILPEIVYKYNNTIHSTIKMKPSNVNANNESQLLKTVYSHIKLSNLITKFKRNEHVRISKHRGIFAKGYNPNWSNEVFTVDKIQYTNPTTYLIRDLSGQPISGAFYEQELQRAKYPDVQLVEKVLKRKGNRLYVKWLGLDEKSWIKKTDLV